MTVTKVFIAEEYFSKAEFENYVKSNNGTKIVLWAPEFITVHPLFSNQAQYEELKDFLAANSIEWKIVTGALDNSFYGEDDRVLYWSDFQFYSISHRIKKNGMNITVYPNIDTVETTYQFSKIDYFNAYSFAFIDALAKNGLLERGLVTLTDAGEIPVSSRYQLVHWEPKILENKFTENRNYSKYIDNANLFRSSLFEFGASITDDYPIVGGEMAYALLTGRFPLFYSGQNTYKILKERYGLETLEDVINYGFDTISKDDFAVRLEMVVNEMKKLCNKFDTDFKQLSDLALSRSAINIQKITKILSECKVDVEIVEIMKNHSSLKYYETLLNHAKTLVVIGKKVYNTTTL